MRLVSISYHLPAPDGSAAGRVLHAVVTGLRAAGHDATVVSWRPEPPEEGSLPAWCRWTAHPGPGSRSHRARSVLRPRTEAAALALDLPADALVVAEDFLSLPAAPDPARAGLTVHNLTGLDIRAIGTRSLADVQNQRAERAAIRRAGLVLASSPRVAGSAPAAARPVPVAHPLPDEVLPVVESPVAVTVADWRWPPNRWALHHLLTAWPGVRDAVAGASLLLAGRGLEDVGAIAGVEVVGPVASSREVLARGAALAFPCPPTTGPKIKVLEALAIGLPVVTTLAGREGLAVGPNAVATASVNDFGAVLADVLADTARRGEQAREGRAAAEAGHAPAVAARARLEALADLGVTSCSR